MNAIDSASGYMIVKPNSNLRARQRNGPECIQIENGLRVVMDVARLGCFLAGGLGLKGQP